MRTWKANEALAHLKVKPIPAMDLNPGVVSFLVKKGLAELKMMRSPHSEKQIQHLIYVTPPQATKP